MNNAQTFTREIAEDANERPVYFNEVVNKTTGGNATAARNESPTPHSRSRSWPRESSTG